MQVQVDIDFEQLVPLAKKLSTTQWTMLKQEVDKETAEDRQVSDLEAFLLTAPTFTKKQLDEIANTRNAINPMTDKIVLVNISILMYSSARPIKRTLF